MRSSIEGVQKEGLMILKTSLLKLLFISSLYLLSEPVISYSKADSLKALLTIQIEDSSRVKVLNELGLAYSYSATDSALMYVLEALDLAAEIDFQPGIAKSHNHLSIIYRLLGNYPQALESGLQALQLYQSTENQAYIARSLNNLGSIYFRLEDYSKSLEYYQQSLDIWEVLEDEQGQANQLVNIGNVLKNIGEPEKALEHYAQALAINRKSAHPLRVSINLENMGELYASQQKFQEALPLLEESLDLSRSIQDQQGIASISRHLAKVYQQTNDLKKSQEYAQSSLKVASYHKLKIEAAAASLILSENYQLAGDHQKALEYYQLHTQYRDSLYNASKLKELSSLESRYAIQQKEQELKIQEQTIQLLNRDNQIDRIWRNILLASLLGILLLGFFIYKFQRLRNRKNAQLLAQEQLINQKLQDLDRAKTRFFTNISHEFRTPLSLIMGPLRELYENRYQGDVQNLYGVMLRNGRRLLDLINQLLDLSKLESGKLVLQAAEHEVQMFMKPILAAYDSAAKSRAITFTVSYPEDPLYLYFDADKLEKVLHNLLSNAFKFTPEGGHIEVNVDAVSTDDWVKISVKDSGAGIPADQLDKVFDRFYQIDNSHTRQQEGSGIGLALAKELAELHKGNIKVESTSNAGSIFTLSLLKDRSHLSDKDIVIDKDLKASKDHHPIQVPSEVELAAPNIDNAMELLIVEDNDDMRQFLKHTLLPHYNIVEAIHGEHGWELALEKIPDIIISDVMMPQMDGVELCSKLKSDQRTSHIPVILLTAKADKPSKLQGLEMGADDYLAKPFDPQELLVILRNRIAQRKRLRERFSREITLQPNDIAITSTDERFLRKAMDIVEQHMSNLDFNVTAFREEMGISRMQLQRKLKALTDQSPVEFIRILRLKRAAQLIEKRKDNISQITYEVGFNNLSYFAKCFKEHFGVAPSKYASQNAGVDTNS